MLRQFVSALVISVASVLLACDDSAKELERVALEFVPTSSEVLLRENCGDSLMTGDCSILYIDPAWAGRDARLVAYREQSQAAGWAVTDSVERQGLVLTRDAYFGTITLGAAPGAIGCPAREDPERCADVIHIRDR
ncbi:MAG: hypothetical protein U0837_13100 [Dehalococcoidia bacterium]|jgi:hypothetical protein